MINNNLILKSNEITECLLMNWKDSNAGLMAGKSGILLYFSKLLTIENNSKYQSVIQEISESIFEDIQKQELTPNLTDGLPGISWTFLHLKKAGIIDFDISENTDINDYIFKSMKIANSKKNYDYFYGSIGNLLYFLEEPVKFQKEIQDGIDDLIKISTISDNKRKWVSYDVEKGEEGTYYDLGIPHGHGAILYVLAKAYETGLFKSTLKDYLYETLNFVTSCHNTNQMESHYPQYYYLNQRYNQDSRLGWCYGDIGLSMIIIYASDLLKDSTLKKNSIDVLLKSCNRLDLEHNSIYDNGICHGTSGLAHMYKKIYSITGHEKFNSTSQYWLNKTMQMSNRTDGYAGFIARHGVEEWNKTLGLLEGITGIGLVLLDEIYGNSDSKITWDKPFLFG